MKLTTLVPLVLVIASLSLCVFSAEKDQAAKKEDSPIVKIAVVDTQKVLKEYEKTKMLEIKLKQQNDVFGEYSDQLEAQLMSLKTEYDSALADSQNVVYSAEVREVRRLKALEVKESMARKEQELRSYNEDSIIRLREMLERMRGDIIKDIQKAAQNIPVIEGYTLVLDKTEDPLRGISFVIYSQPSLDITETVIRNLNRGYRTNAKNPIDEEKNNE